MRKSQPLVRVAALATYQRVATQLGLDTRPLLKKAHLDGHLLTQPDQFVPIIPVVELVEESARVSGCATFGLQMALDRPISANGLISVLLALQPSMGALLETISRYRNSLSSALLLKVERGQNSAVITADLSLPAELPHRQASEFLLAVLVNTVRFLLGAAWTPERVHLVFPAPEPRDRAHYRTAFGPNVEYNAVLNGITVALNDMDRLRKDADPFLALQAAKLFDPFAQEQDTNLSQRVQELVTYLLGSSKANLAETAKLLGMNPRTLQRHLHCDGSNFTALLNQARRRLANRLLQNPRMRVSDVADALDFESSGSFSRWFLREFGQRPSQARRHPSSTRPKRPTTPQYQ